MPFSSFTRASSACINKVKIKYQEKEDLNHFEKRRNSPNYEPNAEKQKESIVSILQVGQVFGVEDSYTENPRKDTTQRQYSYKVVSLE
jgi:hypothetical protein